MTQSSQVLLSELDSLFLIIIPSPHLIYCKLHILDYNLKLADALAGLIQQSSPVAVICLELVYGLAILITLLLSLSSFRPETS